MDIDTKWLRDFATLAVTRNFSEAAKLRHVTQPAFSRRIKALEAQVGTKLVSRLSQPLVLTDEGKLFLEEAKAMIKVLERCEQTFKRKNKPISVTFAAAHTLSLGVFPTLVDKLSQQINNIDTKLETADADDCVGLLKKRHCDYLLGFKDPMLGNYEKDSILLNEVKLLPVCKADANGNPTFNLTAIKENLPYLAYRENIYLDRVVNQFLTTNHPTLRVQKKLEAPMADSLKMTALKGLGVAWIPEFSVKEELKNKLLAIAGDERWQPSLEMRVYRHKTKNPELTQLWNALQTIEI